MVELKNLIIMHIKEINSLLSQDKKSLSFSDSGKNGEITYSYPSVNQETPIHTLSIFRGNLSECLAFIKGMYNYWVITEK